MVDMVWVVEVSLNSAPSIDSVSSAREGTGLSVRMPSFCKRSMYLSNCVS